MKEKMPRVWWVQCKPFGKSERNSDAAKKFQNDCLEHNFFGMGWKSYKFDEYSGKEYNEDIASKYKNELHNRTFTRALNLYGEMKQGDIVFTRLNEIYYLGIISFIPRISNHERLSWYSEVKQGWIKLGTGKEIPHHIRGKISGKKYQGTVAEIDGLSALTLIDLAGIKCAKRKINENNFYEAISDEDLEDLMAHYMSYKNSKYIFLPSSCKKNTPGIEYVMYDPITEKSIVCQTKVKQRIDIGEYLGDNYRKYETIYLFSGAGYDNYNPNELNNVYIVERKELYDIMKNNKHFSNIVSQHFSFV
ncbi:MAG: hypothetical protein K6F76_03025 [Clostridiales bacterium]|nr:hypothetical protein [Clostridiales bacterium]